jgi:group II intron reverse transcriptase/maturase
MIAPSQKHRSVTYEQVCNPNTLRDAWRLVRKGGPAPGVDGQTLDAFAAVADRQLRQIEADLRGRRYRFLPVRRTFVAKLTGGKRRLGIPAIRDRVVEQAMRLVLEPVVSTGFAPVSFAYCSHRGVHQAIDRLLQQRREGNSWILESDVQNFFDTIRHPVLLGLLHGLAIDEVLVGLVADFLVAGSRLGGRWFSSRRGVPQGSPLSPMLANLYLTPFDHALVKQNYELIRYADDLVICCGSRREAQQAQEEMTRQLGLLQLSVNGKKTAILDSRRKSFEFLGFVIGPHSLRPNQASVDRFRQAIDDVMWAWQAGPVATLVQDLNRVIRGFGQHYQRCEAVELFREMDGFVYRQVTGRFRAARLVQRGLDGLVLLRSYLQRAGGPDIGAGPAADFGPYGKAIRPPLQKRRKR